MSKKVCPRLRDSGMNVATYNIPFWATLHSLYELRVEEAALDELVGREIAVAVDVQLAEDLLGPRLRVLLESSIVLPSDIVYIMW